MTKDELIEALKKCADLYEEIQVRKLQIEIKEFETNEK